jgi:predicted NBD/HSP70 family sugar kinase
LCGLGLAAPGPVDVTTGTIVGPPNFPSWEHVDVAKELGEAFDLPVLIDNAATAAAIGIAWRMPHGHGPYLYCYWGIGIGGGLVIGDDVYRGTTGNAIEIGHVVVDPGGRLCECGNVGCLETEASVRALLRDAAPYGRFRTLTELMAAARATPEVAALVTEAAEKVAAALVSVLNIVDVDEVVLGGEHLGEVEDVFLPIIRDHIAHRAFRRRIAPTTVSVSDIGEIANAMGAAALVFHSLLPDGLPGRAPRERERARAPFR